MKTIIIAGASSTAGKTALAESLLRRLRPQGWGGVKITVTHDIIRGCPRGGSGCGVCASVPNGYRIIADPQTITQPRTDTGRLTAAGASPVFWVISTPPFIALAWADLQRDLQQVAGVVVESNSLALCITPGLTFFTINPRVRRPQWKASAPLLIKQSDFVIISLHDTTRERAQALIEEVHAQRNGQGVIVTDAVENALNSQEVQARLQTLSAR